MLEPQPEGFFHKALGGPGEGEAAPDKRHDPQTTLAGKPDPHQERVVVGRVSGVLGLCGWVRVFSYTAPRDHLLSYQPLQIESPDVGWEDWRIAEGAPQGQGIVLRLEGCTDRDQAERLMGRQIAVWRWQFPVLPEGRFYWSDLLGLRVVTVAGVDLGVVEELFETGANDVLVVEAQGKKRMIPFLWGTVVMSVDLNNGSMAVAWDPDF